MPTLLLLLVFLPLLILILLTLLRLLLLGESIELFLGRDHGAVRDAGAVGYLELQLAILARRALNSDIVAYDDVAADPDSEDDRVSPTVTLSPISAGP